MDTKKWLEEAFKQIDLKSELLAWARAMFGIKTSTAIVKYQGK